MISKIDENFNLIEKALQSLFDERDDHFPITELAVETVKKIIVNMKRLGFNNGEVFPSEDGGILIICDIMNNNPFFSIEIFCNPNGIVCLGKLDKQCPLLSKIINELLKQPE